MPMNQLRAKLVKKRISTDPRVIIYPLMVASLGFGTVTLGKVGSSNIRIWEILLGLFIFTSLLKALIEGQLRLSNRISLLPVYFIIVSVLFSGLNATSIELWFKQALLLLAMLTLFIVVAQRCSLTQLTQNLRLVIYPGILLAGWGIAEIFLFPQNLAIHYGDGFAAPRARSFFAEANEFSQFLSLPFAFLVSALLFQKMLPKLERLFYFFGLIVVTIAQIASFSRGGLLAFSVQLLACFTILMFSGAHHRHNIKRIIVLILFTAVVLLILHFTQSFITDILVIIWGRLESLFSGNDITTMARLESIATALSFVSSSLVNVIVGMGLGNLPLILGDGIATSSNFLVDIFSEMGLFGLISVCGIIIAVLLLPLKTMRLFILTKDSRLRTLFFAAYLSFLGLISGGTTYSTHMLNFFWFICGLLIAIHEYGVNVAKVRYRVPYLDNL